MPKEPTSVEETRMPLAGHLIELRSRLLRVVMVIFSLFIVGFSFLNDQLRIFFMGPHRLAVSELAERVPPVEIPAQLSVLSPLEPVFFDLKISLLLALLAGFPYLLYQTWGFIAAGLLKPEKRAISAYLPWAMVFALAGMGFGYFIAIPLLLEFLYAMVDQSLMIPAYRLEDYFALFLMFTFALGLIFQLPLLLLGLSAAGMVDSKFLRRYRRHFILGAFVVGAIFTPPEPFSQFMMAMPTVLLYELGLWMVVIRERSRRQKA
jgi:Tat protein translocase TatC